MKHKFPEEYEFAKTAHEGQFRLSGQPHIIHLESVTKILEPQCPELNAFYRPLMQASLLHDIPKNTVYTLDYIRAKFGKEVAYLVQITNLATPPYDKRGLMLALAEGIDDLNTLPEDARGLFEKYNSKFPAYIILGREHKLFNLSNTLEASLKFLRFRVNNSHKKN